MQVAYLASFKKWVIQSIEKVQKTLTYRSFAHKGVTTLYECFLHKLEAQSLEYRQKIIDFALMYRMTTSETSLAIYDVIEIPSTLETHWSHPYWAKFGRRKASSFKVLFLVSVVLGIGYECFQLEDI